MVDPEGAYQYYRGMKQECSLMPKDPLIGKTDCSCMKADLRRFCIKHMKERLKMSEEKQPAHSSYDVHELEALGSAPSPLATLAALRDLALDSDGSSVANTPADSPITLTQPSLPEPPTSALPKALKTCNTSKYSSDESTVLDN
jgi:hypothetical protein